MENNRKFGLGRGLKLLVGSLVDGSIHHPDVAPNNEIIMKLHELSIRSAGFIEPITEEMLKSFYRSRIGTVADFHYVGRVNLRLNIEDYAPADLLKELDLAPETVEVQKGNRSSRHAVRYEMIDIDGTSTAVGVITIPLSTYQKNAVEPGKASKFPTLPHNIRLMLVIEKQGKHVAVGFDDETLFRKVNKFVKGAARGQRLEGAAKDGYGINGVYEPSTVPPWYKGRRIR